jgi:hypothetical protein
VFRGATYRARLSLQSDLCSTASTKSSHVTPSPQFPSPLDERKKCKDSRGVISQYPWGNRKISSVQITGSALLSVDIFKFDSPLLTAVPPRRDGAIDLFNAGLNEQNDLFLKWAAPRCNCLNHIVSTTRNSASPLIMRAYASAAFSRG